MAYSLTRSLHECVAVWPAEVRSEGVRESRVEAGKEIVMKE
jgi:hypothetical protein